MKLLRVLMAVLLAGLTAAAPFAYYRWQYAHAKRFRVVTPGVLYRSGQMTADGLTEAVRRFGIRTVINFQNETPDPQLTDGLAESELCRQLGVRYVFLPPDLIPRKKVPGARPEVIGKYLEIMDDTASRPVLIHCRAGLHRTGVLAALYRMEYEGWSKRDAVRELKENGFGDSQATARNDYIVQYLLTYTPRDSRDGLAHP